MFKLHQALRQRESRLYAEILSILREGKHTKEGTTKFKERLIPTGNNNYPLDAPHFFIQNAKVNEFYDKVHRVLSRP